MTFCNLHVHTYYSLLDGFSSPEALIDRAMELNQPAMAITEHGNMFNCLQALKYARDKDFNLILGVEGYLTEDMSIKNKESSTYHIVLLAKNIIGYRNLCRLVSIAYKDGFYGYPRMDHKTLMTHAEGLICLTACPKGEIPSRILDVAKMEANIEGYTDQERADADQALHETITWYQNVFGDDLYFELMSGDYVANVIKTQQLVELAPKYGIKLVATNDVHYDKQENAFWHDMLLACNTNTTVNNPNRMRYGDYQEDEGPRFNTGEQYFWMDNDGKYHNSLEEFADERSNGKTYTFKLHDLYYMITEQDLAKSLLIPVEAITNVSEIVDKCVGYDEIEFKQASKMPSYIYRKTETPTEQIEQICSENWERKLSHVSPNKIMEYSQRYTYEISVMKNMGFGDYFLILWDIVSWAKNQGVYVGPGRGSAGGSLVVYLMDITDVDPIQWGLYFERFLNPDRISMPDIDIDFEQSRRDEVVNYIIERFGEDKVSQIITFAKMKAKSVILQAGAVLGVPYGERQKITAAIDTLVEKDTTVADLYEADPTLYNRISSYAGVGKMWVELIGKLEMIPKSAGQHAAGTIISPQPISDEIPIFHRNGEPAAMFDMNLLEDTGYVKFDILGVKTLDHIRITVEFLKKNKNIDMNPWRLPLDDEKALKLYTSGKLTGVFQCKFPGFRKLAQKLDPDKFMHVVDLMCLYRPGPLKEGMTQDYIEMRHGKTVESKFHVDVQKILEPTYGIMLYQEQTMEVARKIFGWSFSEADELRKAIGKKKLDLMNKLKDKALAQADAGETPYPKDIVKRTFELIEPAARYSWNKAHGVEYGLISYVTAYLKAHYPIEFYAALLCTEIGNTDELASILIDVRQEGIGLVPPDINKSSLNFNVDGDNILFGFASIKGVGKAAADAILLERRLNGEFKSFVDFCNRMPPKICNKSVKAVLIHSGAFDFDKYNRKTLFSAIEPITKKTKTKTRTVNKVKEKYNEKAPEDLESMVIIKMVESATDPSKKVKKEFSFELVEEYQEGILLKLEMEAIGIQVSGHMLDKYLPISSLIPDNMIADLSAAVKKPSGWALWIICTVAKVKKHIDKNGGEMAFITLSDQLSSLDCVCFAGEYGLLKNRIAIATPMIARVKLNVRDNVMNGIIDDIYRLDAAIPVKAIGFKRPFTKMDEFAIEALLDKKIMTRTTEVVYFDKAVPVTVEKLLELSTLNAGPEVFK